MKECKLGPFGRRKSVKWTFQEQRRNEMKGKKHTALYTSNDGIDVFLLKIQAAYLFRFITKEFCFMEPSDSIVVFTTLNG